MVGAPQIDQVLLAEIEYRDFWAHWKGKVVQAVTDQAIHRNLVEIEVGHHRNTQLQVERWKEHVKQPEVASHLAHTTLAPGLELMETDHRWTMAVLEQVQIEV